MTGGRIDVFGRGGVLIHLGSVCLSRGGGGMSALPVYLVILHEERWASGFEQADPNTLLWERHWW